MLLQEDKRLGATAAWEKKTDSWIEQNKLQQRFAALKAQADAGLAARQDKLAQKLHAEEQALKQELISCQESPAQRRAQMAARAHELARRREAERQQLAAALMDQAFRDNCDPLRERNSKHLVYRTAQEREQQVGRALLWLSASKSSQRAQPGQGLAVVAVLQQHVGVLEESQQTPARTLHRAFWP